jgi:hypothetical protein
MSAAQKAQGSQAFRADKATSGETTVLTLHGVLAEGFEGKKLAESLRTSKVIVNLKEVRRFASWGMSEWMDFLRVCASKDLYLVEVSTYAVSQINLVTGLLGHAKLVSFYSQYRCSMCNTEFEKLVLVPGDPTGLTGIASSSTPCPHCGDAARLDKYPAAIVARIAERSTYDIDDEVVGLLRTQFKYDVTPDVTRFRAFRRAAKGATYIRVSGDLGSLPAETLAGACEGNTVIDLAGALFGHDFGPWRAFERLAGARVGVRSLQLLDCPDGFLERAQPESLHDKLKVRTFVQSYYCTNCRIGMDRVIDVAENLESLIETLLPPTKCSTCHGTVEVVPGTALANVLRQLPARERDPELDKLVAKARTEPTAKLEDVLAARASKQTKQPTAPSSRMIYLISGLAVLTLAGVVVVALGVWKKDPQPQTQPIIVNNPTPGDAGAGKVFERPDWVISDVPASAFCHDLINRLMCIGVSSYRATRDEGVSEAKNAALDELAIAVGLKVSNPTFQKEILPVASAARIKALTALQNADTDRKSAAYKSALEVVREARKRAVEAFEGSGGPALPAQRSDWYWEEYAIDEKKGSASGTEVLVFVRYDVNLDSMKALVERYSTTAPAGRSVVSNAFPGLAWVNPAFSGGVMLQKVGRPFDASVKPFAIVTSVDDQRITDIASLAKRLEQPAAKAITVLDREPDAKPRTIEVKR